MKRWQRIGCIIMCAACAAVCAAFFVPEKAQRVDIAVCETRRVVNALRVSGAITRSGLAFATPPMAMPVEAVYVTEGEYVKAGQALYKLHTDELSAQLSQLMAQRALVSLAMPDQAISFDAQIELIKAKMAAMTVRSPVDGQVVSIEAEPGRMTQTGVTLAEGGYAISALIPDARIGDIGAGAKVSVSRDGQTVAGVLASYCASASEKGYFQAEITLNADPGWPLGATAQADIIIGQAVAAAIPLEALFIHDDAVLLVIDGYAVRADVTIIEQDAIYAAVSGLPEGASVILYPDDVSEGARVRHEGA